MLRSRFYNYRTWKLRRTLSLTVSCRAPDCGLLSADLAAGIRRVKGVKKLRASWETGERPSNPSHFGRHRAWSI